FIHPSFCVCFFSFSFFVHHQKKTMPCTTRGQVYFEQWLEHSSTMELLKGIVREKARVGGLLSGWRLIQGSSVTYKKNGCKHIQYDTSVSMIDDWTGQSITLGHWSSCIQRKAIVEKLDDAR